MFGLKGTYNVNKFASVTAGIENLLDKRQFRAGNAQSVNNNGAGAGAATYNEPGRTFFVSVNTRF